ncbi:MAG: COX15/CtaA family protein [Candidatus Puniceispirillales bacterium]
MTTHVTSKGGENTAVITWLFTVAAMVFAMVVVGGITRLTGSGLSMVEWRPLMGILPPLSDAEWMRVYDLYRQSPEFIHINTHMGVTEFKTIFFWEYVHRVLGRMIGLAYALPLFYFALRRQIPSGYGLRFLLLLVLGGMQGVIGWWMVKSGLAEDPEVSQYRLAVHLSMALLILSALLWTALDLKEGRRGWPGGHAAGVLAVLAVTIVAGAFVAGMDAGKLYNEYPLMGDGFVPVEYGEEGHLDAFENPASAQFHHRLLALLVVAGVISLWRRAIRSGVAIRGHAMAAAVAGQFILGVATLLYAVPVNLGVLHQAGAATLLASVIWCLHGLARKA